MLPKMLKFRKLVSHSLETAALDRDSEQVEKICAELSTSFRRVSYLPESVA